ncbi:MAG: hypothetical protein AAFU85_22920 [Planctomycetota bacterium]
MNFDRIVFSRALAVALSVCFVILSGYGSIETGFRALILVILPLVCILFPEFCGRVTGVAGGIGRPTITEETPVIFVSIGGWLLLLCMLATTIFLKGWTHGIFD